MLLGLHRIADIAVRCVVPWGVPVVGMLRLQAVSCVIAVHERETVQENNIRSNTTLAAAWWGERYGLRMRACASDATRVKFLLTVCHCALCSPPPQHSAPRRGQPGRSTKSPTVSSSSCTAPVSGVAPGSSCAPSLFIRCGAECACYPVRALRCGVANEHRLGRRR
jgi:hypothetical protein